MDQLRCASGGTLSCEPRIPWPPRAMSPTSQGNTFAKPKGHLLPLIRPDSPCSLSPSSRPTPPSPSIFGRCALAPSAFRPAVEGPDDRWHSLRPHETVSSGLSALQAFLLRQFAQPPPQKKLGLSACPPPASILPTLRVAEATHLGGPPSPQIPEVRRSPRGGTPTPCAV